MVLAHAGTVFVRVLGHLEVTADDRVLEFPEGKASALLALLACRTQATDETKLIDLLWNGHPTKSATSAFRTYLADIRKVVSRYGLVSAGGTHRLHPNLVITDVAVANALTATARELVSFDPSAAIATFKEALGWWRGRPFEGMRHLVCLQRDIISLDEQYASLLDDYLAARLQSGHEVSVLPELRQAVEEEPWREHRTAMLMRALVACGDRNASLDAYQQSYRYLADRGATPGRELVELEQSIVLASLSPRSDRPAEVPPPAQPPLVEAASRAFIGREAVLRAVAIEAGPVCVVVGESGSGKTAIAGHLANSVYLDGVLVAYGAAGRDDPTPFGCLIDAVPAIGRLAHLEAALAVEAVLDWAATTQAAPAILILDDYQWADPLTRRCVDLLVSTRDPRRPILRLFAQPDFDLGVLARFTVQLPPMNSREIEAVMASHTMFNQPAIVALVEQVTGGLAIHVVSLVSYIALHGADSINELSTVAQALSPVLALSFRDFCADDLRIAGAVAVAGTHATPGRVTSMLQIAPHTVEQFVRKGEQQKILVGGPKLAFRHELLALHARSIATGQHVAELVDWLAADQTLPPWDRAVFDVERRRVVDADVAERILDVVADAERNGHAGVAAKLIEMILVRDDGSLEVAMRFRCLAALASAYALRGDVALGRAKRIEAFELAERNGLREAAIETVLRGRSSGRTVVVDEQELSMLRRAAALCGPETPYALVVGLRSELLYQKLFHLHIDRTGIEDDLRVVAEASFSRIDDPVTSAMAHRSMYLASMVGLSNDAPGTHVRALLEAAEVTDHLDVRSTAYEYGVRDALCCGDASLAGGIIDRHAAFTAASARPVDLWAREAMRATLAEFTGDLRRARHHAATAHEIGRRFGCGDAEFAWALHLLSALLYANEAPTTEHLAFMQILEPIPRLLMAARNGTPDVATLAHVIDDTINAPRTVATLSQLAVLAELAITARAGNLAALLIGALSPPHWDERFVVVGHLPVTVFGPRERLLGLLHGVVGNLEVGNQFLASACDAVTASHAHAWVARTQLDRADLLEQLGRSEAAADARVRAALADQRVVGLQTHAVRSSRHAAHSR